MEIEEIDKKLLKIHRSTKTLFKAFSPWHNFLRAKSRLYYLWHLHPWSSHIHFGSLFLYLVLVLFLVFSSVSPPYTKIQAASVTLQPGPEGIDSYVFSFYFPDTNFGNDSNLNAGCGAPPPPNRAYIRFDLSSIPSGSTINSATLSLYYYSYLGPVDSSLTLPLHRVTSSWNESTITWNNQPSFNSSPETSTIVGTAYGWYSWNITSLVSAWVSGSYPNYGLVINYSECPGCVKQFYSSDSSNSSLRPKLVIDYTPPGGTPPPSDNTPPVISNIQIKNITQSSAIISWTTNEASDSKVVYGTSSGSYPNTKSDASLVTSHSINLTNLNPATKYYFRVKSKDASGNEATSAEYYFTTLSPSVSGPTQPPLPESQPPESQLAPEEEKPPEEKEPSPSLPPQKEEKKPVLSKIAENPIIVKSQTPIASSVASLAILAQFLPLASNLPLANPLSLPWAYVYHFFTTAIGFLGIKRKRKFYGIVYDAETRKPIPLAVVRLFSKVYNKLLESQVTDSRGRYAFLAPEGEYYINVVKAGYLFPSKLTKDGYHGQPFKIQEGVISFDIPLDPDTHSLARKIRFWQTLTSFLEYLKYPLLFIGSVLTSLVLLAHFDLINTLTLLLYLLLWSLEAIKLTKTKSYGQVLQKETETPLDLTIIRLFDQKGRLTQTKVSDQKGRYMFLVDKGKWVISALRRDYLPQKQEITTTAPAVVANIYLEKIKEV